MKAKRLAKKDLIKVCDGLYRNESGNIRISKYNKHVEMTWLGFMSGEHKIIGKSISDCIKQYNNI